MRILRLLPPVPPALVPEPRLVQPVPEEAVLPHSARPRADRRRGHLRAEFVPPVGGAPLVLKRFVSGLLPTGIR